MYNHKEYARLRDGYENSDGRHVLGYKELAQRHDLLRQDPAKVLETEEGQQALEEAKEEIVESVKRSILSNIVSLVRTKIFDEFKEHFTDLMYRAIDKMLEGHWITLNDNDRSILTKAVEKSISVVTDVLHLDTEIERDISQRLPDEQELSQQVSQAIKRRGRR